MKTHPKKVHFIFALVTIACCVYGTTLSGRVADSKGASIGGARITLFNGDTALFFEERSDAQGGYSFSNVSEGNYTLGVAFPGQKYEEKAVKVAGIPANINIALKPEAEKGIWNVIISQTPDKLGGTNSAVLLPDGRIVFCHNTKDPFIFDLYSDWYYASLAR